MVSTSIFKNQEPEVIVIDRTPKYQTVIIGKLIYRFACAKSDDIYGDYYIKNEIFLADDGSYVLHEQTDCFYGNGIDKMYSDRTAHEHTAPQGSWCCPHISSACCRGRCWPLSAP